MLPFDSDSAKQILYLVGFALSGTVAWIYNYWKGRKSFDTGKKEIDVLDYSGINESSDTLEAKEIIPLLRKIIERQTKFSTVSSTLPKIREICEEILFSTKKIEILIEGSPYQSPNGLDTSIKNMYQYIETESNHLAKKISEEGSRHYLINKKIINRIEGMERYIVYIVFMMIAQLLLNYIPLIMKYF